MVIEAHIKLFSCVGDSTSTFILYKFRRAMVLGAYVLPASRYLVSQKYALVADFIEDEDSIVPWQRVVVFLEPDYEANLFV